MALNVKGLRDYCDDGHWALGYTIGDDDCGMRMYMDVCTVGLLISVMQFHSGIAALCTEQWKSFLIH